MVQILYEHSTPASAKLFETQALHTKYDVIKAVLSRHNKHDLLNYFAVPNVDSGGHQIEWSTPGDAHSVPVSLGELSSEDRAKIVKEVQVMHDDLYLFKETFSDTGDGRKLRSLLTSLQDIPDERHIYSVDGRPVFVYWSHEQEQPIPEIEYPRLERIDARQGEATHPTGLGGSEGWAEPDVERIVEEVIVARGWIVFVGAVSFFGTALASIALGALALTYLITTDSWPFRQQTVVFISDQNP